MLFRLITLNNTEYNLNAESKSALLAEIETKVKAFADNKEAFNIKVDNTIIHSDSLTIFDEDIGREICPLHLLKVEAVA